MFARARQINKSKMLRAVVSALLLTIINGFSIATNSRVVSARDMSMKALITIGTRGSPLALAQAYETKRLLGKEYTADAFDA